MGELIEGQFMMTSKPKIIDAEFEVINPPTSPPPTKERWDPFADLSPFMRYICAVILMAMILGLSGLSQSH